MRPLAALVLAAVSTASTCDSNVGDGDGRSRETVRLSQREDGGEGSVESSRADVSADGRYVVFESGAEDLVLPDGNGYRDLFLKDRSSGALLNLTWVDPSILVDASTQLTTLLRSASEPRVSADGRFVAFVSEGCFAGAIATPGGIANPPGTDNVYVLDRSTGEFRSIFPVNKQQWPDNDIYGLSLSDDGRILVFHSEASNLNVGDPGSFPQVYAADLSVSPPVVTLVSRSTASATTGANAACTDARVSRDGASIVFLSGAGNLGAGPDQVFLGTPSGAVPELLTRVPGTSTPSSTVLLYPAVSPTGRYVAFITYGSNDLLPGTSGILRLDRQTGLFEHVADDHWTAPGMIPIPSGEPFSLAEDGTIAYRSAGPLSQILLRRPGQAAALASVSSSGAPGKINSLRPAISRDGRWLVWESASTNLVEGDFNLATDVFVTGPLR